MTQKKIPPFRDPVGLEPDGTISMNTGDRMSAETEQYRGRMRATARNSVPQLIRTNLTLQEWADVGEAVAAQVLRDVIATLNTPYSDTAMCQECGGGSYQVEVFAREHGIDLEGTK